jgi:CheY-like chemotaxis protein
VEHGGQTRLLNRRSAAVLNQLISCCSQREHAERLWRSGVVYPFFDCLTIVFPSRGGNGHALKSGAKTSLTSLDQGKDPNRNMDSQASAKQSTEGSRILLVEDNESIADILRFIFEREGFQVEIACDGREAKQRIANGPPPDIVLLDMILPFVNGLQLVGVVRSNPAWRDVPVVVLTGKSLETDIVGALDAGADDYLVKPFQPGELVARVRRRLRETKRASDAAQTR